MKANVLKKVKVGSPLLSNAACNRAAAEKAFAAGVTIQRIAEFWSEIWQLKTEHGRECLSQKYDYEIDDGSGRFETNRCITDDSVKACIQRYAHKG